MKIAALSVLALFLSLVAYAQTAPAIPPDAKNDIQINTQSPFSPQNPVSIPDEPHYAHLLQNDFVQVFDLALPPLDSTLLHRHDHPSLTLTLGASAFVDEVEGQPPANVALLDGETRYTAGGFADILRTGAGASLRNIVIILNHPQDSPQNLGPDAAARPLGSCPQTSPPPVQNNQIPFEQVVPCFETSALRMELIRVEGGKDFAQTAPESAALLVAMTNSNLDVSLAGEHSSFLHAGDVFWFPAGVPRRVSDFLGAGSKFLFLSFKNSAVKSSN
ncbi:MAG TPA: hypothetical protein VJN93_09950 [Candidatus Acidoferrum sp.]|nr:hypothetical protein [Candidatus Acidoferrum sp.]